MLNSFFNAGFKASKCKTLLKLTIPRIKLLRNRRELQIKQMRKDIAKLLETGQEATARIRVEHIIREENMMAAQEIIELFCELIAVRLPIIEAQRECPLDLKEAISSVCFAAPRCADLPELLQVQLLFASKYGKEFVAATTELMPECGVNRQIIDLLSVRAPLADKKLKLLKEIAEEHGLDWDPSSSETELFKLHEDLLNGPRQFDSGSKLPLPKDKHDDLMHSASVQDPDEHSDSDSLFDPLEFPEVPKVVLVRPSAGTGSPSEMSTPAPSAPNPESDHESAAYAHAENLTHQPSTGPPHAVPVAKSETQTPISLLVSAKENKQFVPFISPPSPTSVSVPTKENDMSPLSGTKSIDFQDVLAAAQAAALSAERAAAAARSAASLAQVRISELSQKKNDQLLNNIAENPFQTEHPTVAAKAEKPHLENQSSFGDSYDIPDTGSLHQQYYETDQTPHGSNLPTYDSPEVEAKPSPFEDRVFKEEHPHHQPQRRMSMDDDPYFSYPDLFSSQS
ncbi:hypothetical protein Dimus_006630 [Dionaea muscipula]